VNLFDRRKSIEPTPAAVTDRRYIF